MTLGIEGNRINRLGTLPGVYVEGAGVGGP